MCIRDSAIGYVPNADDINLEGLDLDKATLESILEVDNDVWAEEAKGIEEFYGKFGDKLPQELRDQLNALKDRLAK